MTCIRHAAVALTIMLAAGPTIAADEPDELMPGRVVVVRHGVIAKFVARSIAPALFDLPDANNSPVSEGASLTIFDTGGPGSDTYTLVPGQWTGLGSPPGSKGYKYRGTGTVSDPCRTVLVKQKVVKAVCKGAGVTLGNPFVGDVGIVLAVGQDTKNYCARFGGTVLRNDAGLTKKKTAPAPAQCPTQSNPTTTSSSTPGAASTSTSSTTSSTIGGPCCGGLGFARFTGDGVSGDTCGTITDSSGNEFAPMVCGGMYVGGGGNSIVLPLSTPNNLKFIVGLDNCTGQVADVVPTTSAETGTDLTCTKAGCFFAGPLTIPNASTTPTSACVIITAATDASGTMNCSSGEADISLPLNAAIYLTGDGDPLRDGIQPCPLCLNGMVGVQGSGQCSGGLNNGMACTPANTDENGVNGMDPSYPTSHDCPPLLNASIGSIPIAARFDSGNVKWTGTPAPRPTSNGAGAIQRRVFCGYCRSGASQSFQQPFQQCWENGPVGPVCSGSFNICQQRTDGAFGPGGGTVKTIDALGTAAGSIVDALPHDQTLASVFCIPPTFSPPVDTAADLPGPCALTLKGTTALCAAASSCQ
jgi:hypothetical protein